MSLKCPMCMGELDAEPHRTCPDCETPIHVACGDEIAGCPRYACPRAASTRGRILEYARMRVTQELSVARAVMRTFGIWCGLCVLVGVGTMVYLGMHAGELRDPLTAINFGGFLALPQGAAWVIGITRTISVPATLLGLFGFALPLGAFSLARDKAHRLAALHAFVSAPALTDRAQIVLLRHYTPRRAGGPQLSVPIARAGRVVALLAGLTAVYLFIHAATTDRPGLFRTIPLVYGIVFALVALGLRHVSRSLEEDRSSTKSARRLLELWRPELEDILKATDAAASTEILVDDAAQMKKAKS